MSSLSLTFSIKERRLSGPTLPAASLSSVRDGVNGGISHSVRTFPSDTAADENFYVTMDVALLIEK
jgi:hypothetical protein